MELFVIEFKNGKSIQVPRRIAQEVMFSLSTPMGATEIPSTLLFEDDKAEKLEELFFCNATEVICVYPLDQDRLIIFEESRSAIRNPVI